MATHIAVDKNYVGIGADCPYHTTQNLSETWHLVAVPLTKLHLKVQRLQLWAVLQQHVYQLHPVAGFMVQSESLKSEVCEGWLQEGLQEVQTAHAAR
jgi:hypothetical protein